MQRSHTGSLRVQKAMSQAATQSRAPYGIYTEVEMAFAMWSSLLPTLLVLIFCVASVSADCYTDILPSSNNSVIIESPIKYNNCDTCYRTLVNALLNTDNNKYNISTTMFPLDHVPPIYVEVYYVNTDDCETIKSTDIKTFCESNPNRQLWYWTAGTFYVYQPLDVFYYRSLFFSDPSWRTGTLSVCIPADCAATEEFYRTLTQRVSMLRLNIINYNGDLCDACMRFIICV